MSNYYCKIKIKNTGEEVDAVSLDDYFGIHRYGFRPVGGKKVYQENEVDELGAIPPPTMIKELKIGYLRQWLNEDRITDPKKMVTNEQIETMLGINTVESKTEATLPGPVNIDNLNQ